MAELTVFYRCRIERLEEENTALDLKVVDYQSCLCEITCGYDDDGGARVARTAVHPRDVHDAVRIRRQKMSLFWGVESVVCEPQDLLVDVAARAAQYCRDKLDAKVGEKVIVTAGLPFNVTGNTNLLHIFTITERSE